MTDTQELRLSRLESQVAQLQTYSVEAFWTALDRAYEFSLSHRELICIVCGQAGLRSDFSILTDRCMFGGGMLERYKCPSCDAVFGPQKYLDLSEDFVNLDYALLYSHYKESNSTANEVRTFRSLDPVPGKLYLNWGCGIWSETIVRLREEGFDVWGFEPNAISSDPHIVSNREHISARFDGIFSNNVIEHFRNPVGQFREFNHILKPGGVMAHSSPCYEYAYAITRFHTLFLMGQSPEVLARRAGFRAKNRIEDGDYINIIFERA